MQEGKDIIENFDPNGVGVKGSIFGLPFQFEQAKIIIIPVPWDVTTSYSDGTALAPQAIFDASTQIDYVQEDIPEAWKMGIYMLPIPKKWKKTNSKLRKLSQSYLKKLEEGASVTYKEKGAVRQINTTSENLHDWVYKQSLWLLGEDKFPVVLGGEHSCPLGLMKALNEKKGSFGILQIDAHSDLRPSYGGFEFSHASIMDNALKISGIEKLVQVGIRDISPQEMDTINDNDSIVVFSDATIKKNLFEGGTWLEQCNKIVEELPDQVYISFDIDGLDPKLCPNTGTPVPGGLEFDQALFLIKKVVESGKKIIGFDLSEVGCDCSSDWDANVGARVLYRLSNLTGVSNGWLKLES
ncbi:MAG: agmatinase family protein [Bacteroidota bacterium]